MAFGKKFEENREKALRASIREGAANSFSTSVSNSYIVPFALKLTSSSTYIGLLSSFSGLAAPLAQIFGSNLMDRYPRKKIVTFCVLVQALLWLPLALLAFLSWRGISPGFLLYGLIIIYTLLVSFGGVTNPPWFSWMGDLVPEKERGRYFAKRNLTTGLVDLASVLIALFILKAFEKTEYAILGFGVLFVLSFLFRLVSFGMLKAQYIPHLRPRKSYGIRFSEFLKDNKNFKRFAMYQLLFNIAIMFASPFFAVYMLQDLKFSYLSYVLVTMSSTAFYLLFTPIVGKFSDRYGNLRLLYISNIFFILSPLAWIFIKNPVILIVIPQLISGIANASLTLALTNFSYDSLKGEERGVGVAYLNVLTGAGVFIGSIIGGIVLDRVQIPFMDKFLFVFAVAAGLRFLVALIFLPGIKEERRVPRMHPLAIVEPSIRSFHSETRNFVFYLREKEAEGLKVWNNSVTNAIRKKR